MMLSVLENVQCWEERCTAIWRCGRTHAEALAPRDQTELDNERNFSYNFAGKIVVSYETRLEFHLLSLSCCQRLHFCWNRDIWQAELLTFAEMQVLASHKVHLWEIFTEFANWQMYPAHLLLIRCVAQCYSNVLPNLTKIISVPLWTHDCRVPPTDKKSQFHQPVCCYSMKPQTVEIYCSLVVLVPGQHNHLLLGSHHPGRK